MKKISKYIVLTLFLGCIGFFLYVKYSIAENGKLAPDFETELIDGTSFKLSNLKGKYVLLDFWGSWCAPCLKESPQLVELHHKYIKELIIVTIALEKDNIHWKKAANKFGFVWANQIVDENQFVLMSSIARKYGVTEIPAKFLISPEGKLLGRYSFDEIHKVLSE